MVCDLECTSSSGSQSSEAGSLCSQWEFPMCPLHWWIGHLPQATSMLESSGSQWCGHQWPVASVSCGLEMAGFVSLGSYFPLLFLSFSSVPWAHQAASHKVSSTHVGQSWLQCLQPRTQPYLEIRGCHIKGWIFNLFWKQKKGRSRFRSVFLYGRPVDDIYILVSCGFYSTLHKLDGLNTIRMCSITVLEIRAPEGVRCFLWGSRRASLFLVSPSFWWPPCHSRAGGHITSVCLSLHVPCSLCLCCLSLPDSCKNTWDGI